MKHLFLFVAILSSTFTNAATDTVHHPDPKDPQYVEANLYETFRNKIPLPPAIGSEGQVEDERMLFKLQKERSTQQCEWAKTEVFVSLNNFYKRELSPMKESQFKKLSEFFEIVRNDGDYFIQKLKKDFPRQRPYNYIRGIMPCVPKEVTGAYPSGHATLSQLYALILSDFFPSLKEKLTARSIEIGNHRILSGMHHPSDVKTGQALGELIYIELKKVKKFRAHFVKLKKEVSE